ncbi:MAG: hypothetical protein ACI3VR_06185 [Intestinibacter sp.]|uniref:hypothetical protein n=1 Tax=Intestinibacter sp. TaxID=1965304 RepID=UPI003F1442BF
MSTTKNCNNVNYTKCEKIDSLIKKYVRLKTYLSMKPIYGEILESTEYTITVVPKYIGSFEEVDYDKLPTYLLPKSSIIDIREIV